MEIANLNFKSDDEKVSEALLKGLPCNIDAENAVLGSFLNNNENVNKVADILLPEHFYVPLNRKIYEAILKLMERNLIATPITLKNYFEKEETLEKTGIKSLDYLLKLSSNATSIINLLPYAKDIYETSIKRYLINIGESVIEESYNHDINTHAVELIEKTEQKLFNLASQGYSETGFLPIRNSLSESIRRIDIARKRGEDINGISTGFVDLDKILGGLQDSDLLILAARPSMGKTALAINVALNSAVSFLKEKDIEKKKSVGIFSLEMSSEQIVNRLLSIKTSIDGSRIRIGNISKEEFEVLLKESSDLNEMPIYIDDTPALTISAVRTRARRLKRQYNLGLIIIDYLQLLRSSSDNRERNRVQEIGEISQGLKAIAKELDIPVIALSQLSRAVENREDKRPQLSDLRESGNIEQDADVVMFIYREEYYKGRQMPQVGTDGFQAWQDEMDKIKNIADIIIAKQRNGPIGNISLRYDNRTTGFNNLEKNTMTLSQY
jgi:replicative DNA helicase